MNISKINPEQWKEIVKGLVVQLKVVADQKNITQEELADRTGMIQSGISRIFKGKHIPKLSTIVLIAIALGVEIKIVDPSKE